MSKDGTLSSGGAVPPLVPELALALGNGQPCSFLDAGQQEVLPTAKLTLLGPQREAGTAQLLGDVGRGHAQPPGLGEGRVGEAHGAESQQITRQQTATKIREAQIRKQGQATEGGDLGWAR